MDGGTPLISYEIQIDDGKNGAFATVLGGIKALTLETKIAIT